MARAVIVATIVISFLSLMNFADFIRMELQPPQVARGGGGGDQRRRNQQQQQQQQAQDNNNNNNHHAPPPPLPVDWEIDNELWVRAQQEIVGEGGAGRKRQQHPQPRLAYYRPAVVMRGDDQDNTVDGVHEEEEEDESYVDDDDDDDNDDDDDDDDDGSMDEEHSFDLNDDDDDNDDDDYDSIASIDDDDSLLFDNDDDDEIIEMDDDLLEFAEQRFRNAVQENIRRLEEQHNNNNNNPGMNNNNNNDARRNNFDLDNNNMEDPIDMDVNVALDELLGLRGPIGAVVRNLLWLLGFNAIYLAFFVFLPRVLGMAGNTILFNTTMLLKNSTGNVTLMFNASDMMTATVGNLSSVVDVFRAVEAQSERVNTTLRLSDILCILLGYMACGSLVLLLNFLWFLSKRFGRRRNVNTADELNRLLNAPGGEDGAANFVDEDQGAAVALIISVALDSTTAVVKIAMLLFLKMFLLPVALGLCLDVSTLNLLGGSLESRIHYAGMDLFSFTLLHWVAGITFMLLVTVSVLQLREVVHPEILAQIVRPQEPQPDLLGNLLHESVATHAKRMTMSLIIYVCLLMMHIDLPIRLFTWLGLAEQFPQLKFSYTLMPQLQVPLELLFFHLCMLGLLEKNKNVIGELQHHWFKFMGRQLGIVDSILPRDVRSFELRESIYVYIQNSELNPFLQELANCKDKQEEFIAEKIGSEAPLVDGVCETVGGGKPDGTRVIDVEHNYIRLPIRVPGRALRCRSMLLPTTIGRYRLQREERDWGSCIDIWEEVGGDPIARPPEGWDDLGHGGAFEQGRWAWGREKKSVIENSVAHRVKYFKSQRSLTIACLKIVFLALLSWLTASILLCLLVFTPFALGRGLLYVCRLSEDRIHDPLAFALGSVVFFPSLRSSFRMLLPSGNDSVNRRLSEWMFRFRLPPIRKMMVLLTTAISCVGLAPLLVGSIVDLAFIKTSPWFMGEEQWIDQKSLVLNWILGAIILRVWIQLSRIGIMTKGSWRRLFAQDNERNNANANNNNNDNRDAAANGRNNRNETADPILQEESDRSTQFYSALKAAVLDFEYDRVDPTVFLRDFSFPLVRELALTLVVPSLCLYLFHSSLSTVTGMLRVFIIRGILLLSCTIQMSRVWPTQANKLFEAVQKTARDDLYLIGEVLQNYPR